MSTAITYLLICLMIFAATVLAVVAISSNVRHRAETLGRVNKRSRRFALADSQAEEAVALHRRPTTQSKITFVPGRAVIFLEQLLIQGGMSISVQRLVLMMAGATLVIATAFPLAAGMAGRLHPMAIVLLMAFAGSVGVGAPILFLSHRASLREKKLQAQFPVALDVFVRGLRAGHPINGALELLVSEMPEPIRGEFQIVTTEMNYGYDLRGALDNLAKRVKSQDVQMFVVSVGIQSETGGNLADILEGLAKVIRDRAGMVLKVRALSSEGRMTATVLSILPIGTFCLIFLKNPGFYIDVADDSWFSTGFFALICWYLLGIFMMSRMIKIRV